MNGDGGMLWIAVPTAVLGAAAFGLTGALQHRAARQTDIGGTVSFELVLTLLRHPLWLASLLTNGLGIAMQWLALSLAPLVMVQPLLVTALIFAVISSSVLRRHRPDRVVLLGSGLCVAGLAAFFLLARPTGGGREGLSLSEVLPLAGGLAVILLGCLTAAVRHPGRVRVLALATATGVLYGVTAGLAKLAAEDLRHGVLTMLTSWHVYLVLVCGVTGFVLNQNAFRVGIALAPALAVIVGLDPLVSIGVGALWLGERLNDAPAAVAGQVLAVGVLLAGIAVLSKRAPQAAQAEEQAERKRSGKGGERRSWRRARPV
ncbi:magnesium transporter NIPA [Prauserella shujinwangii]|uniref:Magnesium transporter NIPA n=1 Tax=Prauserella shujinwangii TaxID=1453103 RepID=A0A2T0LR24_9PSEU|nr:DMT family transporter [Prauserella shujinwangii]PRX45903.1 magnesium transporter NIPA [Prauserella shujinwangii]